MKANGRRRVLQFGMALGAGWTLPARACEFYADTLRVWHPWARATPEGAESALVGMSFDQVTVADRLVGVETMVAERAETGGLEPLPKVDIPIPEGQTTVLAETGRRTLRLVGLRQPLEVGRAYPLKLVFEKGGVVDATLNIDYTAFRFR